MLKTKVRPIATGARWAGRPATAVLAYLAPKDGAPRSRGGDGLDETIGQSLFHDLPLTAHIARDPGISRVPLGSQDSPVSGERLRKATNDCLLYHQLLEDVLRKVAIDYECRRTLSLTSPRREASLFKLGRSLWFRPFSFLPFPAATDACHRQTRRGHPRPRGVARANPLPMTLQFDGPHAVGCGKSRPRER